MIFGSLLKTFENVLVKQKWRLSIYKYLLLFFISLGNSTQFFKIEIVDIKSYI